MKELLVRILQRINSLGGDTRPLIFDDPALFDEVYEVERQLNYKLPDIFKNVLLTLSSHCEFKWFLPDNFPLPNELRGIFSGELHWGIDLLLDFNRNKDRWIEQVFPDPGNEYDIIWHNKFVFQEVGNGDYISIDLLPETYGKIIYLSHDDGEGHGYVMANSFSELLDNWTQLGCVGGEDWQWLPFCKEKLSGLDPTCSNALTWRQITGFM